MDVDEALSHLGKFGRWQVFTYTLVCLSVTISGCWHMMVIVFTGWEPAHHCAVPEGSLLNETIPLVVVRGKLEHAQCQRYVNFSISNTTAPCGESGWYYEPEFKSTIVTEWDLVCERNYLSEMSQSMFAFGVMVGAVVFTALADKIGRKPVHLGCQWAMIALGIGVALAPNYITFVTLRFFLGAAREGAGLTGIVMACELFPARQRTFAGTALELFWAAAWMMLAGLAYFIRHWRHLQLAISLPPVGTLVLIWLLPESIPWLAANGKIEEAERILRTAAKFSKVSFPNEKILRREDDVIQLNGNDVTPEAEVVTENHNEVGSGQRLRSSTASSVADVNTKLVKCKDTEEDETSKREPAEEEVHVHNNATSGSLPRPTSSCSAKHRPVRKLRCIIQCICTRRKPEVNVAAASGPDRKNTCLDIVRSPRMLLYASIMCSLWFASGIVYFGLSLGTSTLAGDKYLNFFLSGAVEAPAYLLTVFVLQRFGRRWPLCTFHLIAGVVLFANLFIPEVTAGGRDLTPLITTLTMVGKFAMTAAFGTVVLYAPEIYPTNLRNLGFGLASVAGRLAAMLAPFTTYIGKMVPWLPGLVFTLVSVVTGLLALLLPETLNRPLPDSIEDIENWNRHRNEDQNYGIDKSGCGSHMIRMAGGGNGPLKDETSL